MSRNSDTCRGHSISFSDGACTPFHVSLSPLFSYTRYRRKAFFAAGCQQGILLEQVIILSISSVVFTLPSILLTDFSKAGHHLTGKILEPDEESLRIKNRMLNGK